MRICLACRSGRARPLGAPGATASHAGATDDRRVELSGTSIRAPSPVCETRALLSVMLSSERLPSTSGRSTASCGSVAPLVRARPGRAGRGRGRPAARFLPHPCSLIARTGGRGADGASAPVAGSGGACGVRQGAGDARDRGGDRGARVGAWSPDGRRTQAENSHLRSGPVLRTRSTVRSRDLRMPDQYQYLQGTPGAAAQRLRPPSRRAEGLSGSPRFRCDGRWLGARIPRSERASSPRGARRVRPAVRTHRPDAELAAQLGHRRVPDVEPDRTPKSLVHRDPREAPRRNPRRETGRVCPRGSRSPASGSKCGSTGRRRR